MVMMMIIIIIITIITLLMIGQSILTEDFGHGWVEAYLPACSTSYIYKRKLKLTFLRQVQTMTAACSWFIQCRCGCIDR